MYKSKKLFSNKLCDLLVHASFNKLTGPAKVFLNNRIIYFKKKLWVLWFLWWWSLQIGQLNKSPCRYQRTLQNSKKRKNHQFHKTLPSKLSFNTNNIYKKDTLGLLLWWHFIINWAFPEFIHEQTFWRFTDDVYKILRYKIQRTKTPHFSKLCCSRGGG